MKARPSILSTHGKELKNYFSEYIDDSGPLLSVAGRLYPAQKGSIQNLTEKFERFLAYDSLRDVERSHQSKLKTVYRFTKVNSWVKKGCDKISESNSRSNMVEV